MENIKFSISYVNKDETIGSTVQSKQFTIPRQLEIEYSDYTELEITSFDFKLLAKDIKALTTLSEYGSFEFYNKKPLFISTNFTEKNKISYIRNFDNIIQCGSLKSGNFSLKLLNSAFNEFSKIRPIVVIAEKKHPLTLMQGDKTIAIAGLRE